MKLLQRIKEAWALESFKPDVPLSRDETNRFLPWIIALMVYLTALTLTGSFTLHRAVAAGHAAQVESFSVHLPHTGEKPEEAAKKALALIRETPAVAEAELVDADRIREMVEPWLGKSEALKNLPLPMIIDARLVSGGSMDYAGLQARLQKIAPGADIDDHKQWIGQFSGFVRRVQWMLLGIAVMIMTASAASVIFACKTSLKIHRNSIALLHRLGAYDGYIASQFQQHAMLLALKGAFIGSGFAAGTMLVLHLMAVHIDSALFPSFSIGFSQWLILVSLPVLMSAIALASARFSVLMALHRMP
jgi:cell division transport system permease protein